MAGEIIYADLNIPEAGSSSRPLQRSQHLSSPPCPQWHHIAVGVGWAGNIILTIIVIALGAWEGSRCKLCPRDWRPHGDKCYWLSRERKDWAGSRDDCLQRSSRMLMIQTPEEMAYIQDMIRGENYFWIGVKVTPLGQTWTWLDGSPLDPARFSVSGSAEGNSCGWIQSSGIESETCDAELNWICQRNAVVI